jgi:hypothetical protein
MAGLIGDVIESLVVTENDENSEDVKVDPGGGANLTIKNSNSPGEDSPAFPTDLVVMMRVPGSEHYVAVGYIDKKNKSEALQGEKRLYARDTDGNPCSIVWLKNDGSVRLNLGTDWAVQFTALQTEFNELQQKHNDLLTEFLAHMHPTAAAGSPSVPTPINPQTPSVANIDNTKVDSVRLP